MPDSGYPNYLTVDAVGRVVADFSGHVRAAGLDLFAGDDSSAPTDRRVRWLRAQDGSLVASIYSYAQRAPAFTPESNTLASLAGNTSSGFDALASLSAQSQVGSANLLTASRPSSGIAQVSAQASGTTRVLVDSQLQSDFLQIAGNSNPRRSKILNVTFTWAGGDNNANTQSLGALFGFTVLGVVSGANDDNHGFYARPVTNIPAGLMNCQAYGFNGLPVQPAAGSTQSVTMLAFGTP